MMFLFPQAAFRNAARHKGIPTEPLGTRKPTELTTSENYD